MTFNVHMRDWCSKARGTVVARRLTEKRQIADSIPTREVEFSTPNK